MGHILGHPQNRRPQIAHNILDAPEKTLSEKTDFQILRNPFELTIYY